MIVNGGSEGRIVNRMLSHTLTIWHVIAIIRDIKDEGVFIWGNFPGKVPSFFIQSIVRI